MKQIIMIGMVLVLVLIVGCEQAVQDDTTVEPASAEEAVLEDSLAELEDLDALDQDLSADFDELEGYLE